MNWLIIFIAILLLFTGIILLVKYKTYYENHVNKVFRSGVKKQILTPKSMMVFSIILIVTSITIIFNIFPDYEINDFGINDAKTSKITTYTNLDFNTLSFAKSDIKITDDGNYIVSYYNNPMSCFHIGEVCTPVFYNSSKITYFNQDYNELWSLGGNVANAKNILYDNHQYTSYAIDQLEDGRFISLGRAVELDSNILYNAFMIINQAGQITEMHYLDYQQYLIQSNSQYNDLEIIQTDDGGFTLKYIDSVSGSLLVHYDRNLEEVWHYLFSDIEKGMSRSYLETLNYVDNTYYVLTDKTVTSLSSDGTELWKKTFDFTITSINSIDGDLVLSGKEDKYIINPNSSYKIGDSSLLVNSFKTIRINSLGDIILDTEHLSLAQDNTDLATRYTFSDEVGNIYNLLIDIEYSTNLDYQMYLLKFSNDGEFIGSETVEGTYNRYDDLYHLAENHLYIMNYSYEDDVLKIFTPNTSIHREINIESLAFEDQMPIDFNIGIYDSIVSTRVYLNNITRALIIGYLLYLGYYFYTKDTVRDKKIDDNPFI